MNFERPKLMAFMLFQAAERANKRGLLAFAVEADEVKLLRAMRGLSALRVLDHE